VGLTIVEQIRQDVRYALRTMIANRTFTALAALSLALGIGANTAVYSFMEAILLRVVTGTRPRIASGNEVARQRFSLGCQGLFVLHRRNPSQPQWRAGRQHFPYPALELFRNNGGILTNAFCYFGAGRLNVTIRGETEAVEAQYVSGDYFQGMGVPPATGA